MRMALKAMAAALISSLAYGCAQPAPAPPQPVAAKPVKPIAVKPANNPEDVLDHFVCYTFKQKTFTAPGGIALSDQFYELEQKTTVLTRELLCNPASKKHNPSDPFPDEKHADAHLVCYKTEGPNAGLQVKISNQIQTNAVMPVGRERYLCLPSGKQYVRRGQKPPERPPSIPANGILDHFKCYDLAGKTIPNKYFNWKDEFTETVFKHDIAAELICNPTEKHREGEKPVPPSFSFAHLVCYSLFTLERFGRDVKIANQFETPAQLLTVNEVPRFLCVPSTKEIAEDTP